MKRRKLKAFVVPVVYILSISFLILGVYFMESILNGSSQELKNNDNEVDEVINQEVIDNYSDEMPVVSTEATIMKPYTNPDVKVLKDFYDYKGEASNQENSIVYYGNTYMQNSGIDYGMDNEFDVVSVLDGTVMEVSEDEIMGKTIKIKHNNDLISVYQSMGSINVKVDDVVNIGTIIGKSGENNIGKDLGKHLHFELYYKGSVVNPLDCYDKLPSQLN